MRFILLWLVILLTITVLRVDRGVVHMVVVGDIVDHYCLMFDSGVVHIVVADDIVKHYCLRFERGAIYIVVAGEIILHYCFESSQRSCSYGCGW